MARARNPGVRRCPKAERKDAKRTPRRKKTLEKERIHTTCHPEERNDEGSASTKVPPPLGQIPPLAALAFGMTEWGWAPTLGAAFGMTAELKRAFHCGRESCVGSAVGISLQGADL